MVVLYFSTNDSDYYVMYAFDNVRNIRFNKSNGLQSMPIPATGDEPMLMNLGGEAMDISITFVLKDRTDKCGASTDLPFINSSGNYVDDDGVEYDLNYVSGQIKYLTDKVVTGELGSYYKLVVSTSNSHDDDVIFMGIPKSIAINWAGGTRVANAELKFIVGMVLV